MERLLYNYREQFRFQFSARHLKWWVVAKEAGISRQSFFDIEQGNKLPTEEELNRIKAVFREYDPSLTGFPDIPIKQPKPPKQPKKKHKIEDEGRELAKEANDGVTTFRLTKDQFLDEYKSSHIHFKEFRKKYHLSAINLSTASKIAQSTISKLENGHLDLETKSARRMLLKLHEGYLKLGVPKYDATKFLAPYWIERIEGGRYYLYSDMKKAP